MVTSAYNSWMKEVFGWSYAWCLGFQKLSVAIRVFYSVIFITMVAATIHDYKINYNETLDTSKSSDE